MQLVKNMKIYTKNYLVVGMLTLLLLGHGQITWAMGLGDHNQNYEEQKGEENKEKENKKEEKINAEDDAEKKIEGSYDFPTQPQEHSKEELLKYNKQQKKRDKRKKKIANQKLNKQIEKNKSEESDIQQKKNEFLAYFAKQINVIANDFKRSKDLLEKETSFFSISKPNNNLNNLTAAQIILNVLKRKLTTIRILSDKFVFKLFERCIDLNSRYEDLLRERQKRLLEPQMADMPEILATENITAEYKSEYKSYFDEYNKSFEEIDNIVIPEIQRLRAYVANQSDNYKEILDIEDLLVQNQYDITRIDDTIKMEDPKNISLSIKNYRKDKFKEKRKLEQDLKELKIEQQRYIEERAILQEVELALQEYAILKENNEKTKKESETNEKENNNIKKYKYNVEEKEKGNKGAQEDQNNEEEKSGNSIRQIKNGVWEESSEEEKKSH